MVVASAARRLVTRSVEEDSGIVAAEGLGFVVVEASEAAASGEVYIGASSADVATPSFCLSARIAAQKMRAPVVAAASGPEGSGGGMREDGVSKFAAVPESADDSEVRSSGTSYAPGEVIMVLVPEQRISLAGVCWT